MACQVPAQNQLPLVPYPNDVQMGGSRFVISEKTKIQLSNAEDEELRMLAGLVFDEVLQETGIRLEIADSSYGNPVGDCIWLKKFVVGMQNTPDMEFRILSGAYEKSEYYKLGSYPNQMVLTSSTYPGLFYGIQTLNQLIRHYKTDLPSFVIEDSPRFRYRGMHLDVGRHFYSVDFIKKYIDILAMYKINTFHWHLTEDQGWRIEIKKYPKLTEIGSCRKETMVAKNFNPYLGDKKPYCGFYTQAEIREVVAYAQRRYVNIIPEIEMPGHATAALAAHPEFSCTPDKKIETITTWGVFYDIYCPTEETFTFLEDVLSEVIALFPSPYIHIGGDEAPKKAWKESAFAQNLMREKGLKDEHELQSYFIKRIDAFLTSNGKSLIGWDEILEGGLSPNATVMSWRGIDGGVTAAKQKHNVIMTPTTHCYLDYYQAPPENEPLAIGGFLPMEKVYAFNPMPDALNREEQTYIMGVQGNVWTEYMPTSKQVEYMAFPRAFAIAEIGWTKQENRNFEQFKNRLKINLPQLSKFNLNHWNKDF